MYGCLLLYLGKFHSQVEKLLGIFSLILLYKFIVKMIIVLFLNSTLDQVLI